MSLSSAEVCRATGATAPVLNQWVAEGAVRPALVPGLGRAGAPAGWVAGSVRLLAGLGIDRLRGHLAAGRTLPVPGLVLGAGYLPGLMIDPRKALAPMSPGARALLRRVDRLPAVVKAVDGKIERLLRRAGGR